MINVFSLLGAIRRKLRFNRYKFCAKGENVQWNGGIISDAHNISIGEHVYIGPGASIHGRGAITIGDGVIFGPRVTIHSSNHNYESEFCVPYDGGVCTRPVVVEAAVWIGDGVMICPGVRIGRGSIIGMGSVVSKDIPPFSVAAGNPARVIKKRENHAAVEKMIAQRRFYLKLKKNREVEYFDLRQK